jgi:tyrosine-protein phosphatase SIW14
MPRSLRWFFGCLIAVLLIGGPIAYSSFRQAQLRAFRVVREDVLYRSGQLSLSGLKKTLRDYQIKTVISLRYSKSDGGPPPDIQEELFCKSQDIAFRRIKLDAWWASDNTVPAEKGVRQFLKIMDSSTSFPVLIHCFAGAHRTGACCAIYRMEYERWPNEQAIAEMKECGYRNIDDEFDLLGYLERYQPRWKNRTTATTVSQSRYAAPVRAASHRRKKKSEKK